MHSSRISFHIKSNLSKCYLAFPLTSSMRHLTLHWRSLSQSLSLSFLCVCICVCTCAHTYMCMWKQEVNVGCLLHLLNTFSFWSIPKFCLPLDAWILGGCHTCPDFTWVLRNQSLVLTCIASGFPIEPFPQVHWRKHRFSSIFTPAELPLSFWQPLRLSQFHNTWFRQHPTICIWLTPNFGHYKQCYHKHIHKSTWSWVCYLFYLFSILCWGETSGLLHARQVIYLPLSYIPGLKCMSEMNV